MLEHSKQRIRQPGWGGGGAAGLGAAGRGITQEGC